MMRLDQMRLVTAIVDEIERQIADAADIEVKGGIPIPGKGENSWDIDDDAIVSIGMRGVRTGAEASRKFYESVMRDRLRHATADWKPNDGWPAHCLQGIEEK